MGVAVGVQTTWPPGVGAPHSSAAMAGRETAAQAATRARHKTVRRTTRERRRTTDLIEKRSGDRGTCRLVLAPAARSTPAIAPETPEKPAWRRGIRHGTSDALHASARRHRDRLQSHRPRAHPRDA